MSAPEVSPIASKRQHFLALDFLRGIAALSVVILHWLEGLHYHWFFTARLAVDFFFLLSGFVMAYSYEGRLRSGLSFRQFLIFRIIRLYPMILIGILVGVARVIMRGVVSHDADLNLVDLFEKFVLNIFMIPNFLNDWSAELFPLNIALWSLFFEFIAYIAFGLFMFNLRSWVLAVITLVGGLAVFGWLNYDIPTAFSKLLGCTYLPWIEDLFSFARVVFSFTLGILLYRMRDRITWDPKLNAWPYVVVLFAILSIPEFALKPVANMFILAVAFPGIILLVAKASVDGITRPIAVFFGDLSYPLYAVHTPLIWILGGVFKLFKLERFHIAQVSVGLIVIPITIAAAYWIFKAYDEPVRRYLTRLYFNTTAKQQTS